jgi:hypothetical protein
MGDMNCMKDSDQANVRGIQLEDLSVDGRIILK